MSNHAWRNLSRFNRIGNQTFVLILLFWLLKYVDGPEWRMFLWISVVTDIIVGVLAIILFIGGLDPDVDRQLS